MYAMYHVFFFFFQNLKMETLFSNPGLSIIAIDIFQELDPNSFTRELDMEAHVFLKM